MALTFTARTGSSGSAEDYANFEDGVYEIELKDIESVPNKFYEPPLIDSTGQVVKKSSGTPEQWQFRFTVPSVPNLEVRFWANQVMGEKTAAQHVFGCLIGRPLTDTDTFTDESLRGKRCRCMVTLNPDTGFPRIKGMNAFVMPRARAQAPMPGLPLLPGDDGVVTPAASPARPLPPPPSRKAAAPALRDETQLNRLFAAGLALEDPLDAPALDAWAVTSYGHGLDALTPAECEELIAALGGAPF